MAVQTSAALRAALRRRDRVLRALIVEFLDPGLVELCAGAGYDLLILDGEHSPVDGGLADLVRAAELAGTPVLLRAPPGLPLGPYLETGIAGVHLAQAETVDEVQRVVDVLKFRPLGRRGSGRTRLARYGAVRQDAAFTSRVDDETILLVAVESPEGLAATPAIAAHPAVDAILAGTGDLSHSLGVPGDRDDPLVLDAVGKVEAATRASGKGFGLPYGSSADARAAVERGATLLLCSFAGLAIDAAAADLAALGR